MSRPTARPLIGVTTYRQDTRWWSWDRDAALVPGVYLDTVVAAGGWPVLFPPLADGVAEEGDAVAVTRVVGLAGRRGGRTRGHRRWRRVLPSATARSPTAATAA